MLSLEHLVQHYMRFSDGLPTKLRYPVEPIPKPPLPPPPPPQPASQGQTPPKGKDTFFSFKKMRSSPVDDSVRERKLSKDVDSSPLSTPPQLKERNLSLPSDDLMNQVGLSNPNMNISLSPIDSTSTAKVKKSPRKASTDILNFNSLKFPKGRNIIIDGMKSLKISKKDGKAKLKEASDSSEHATNLMANDNISKSLKNLTFSSDINDSSIYKVPKNIPVSVVARSDDIQNQNLSSMATLPLSNRSDANPIRTHTGPDEIEQFTRRDKHINVTGAEEAQDKDNAIEEIYFIEAPTKVLPISSVPFNYVAFKQIPYFPRAAINQDAQDPTYNNAINNNSTAHLAITNNNSPPSRGERVLSSDSTFSNELDLMLAFHNQTNNPNGNSANSSGGDSTKTSPNYFLPGSCIQLNNVLGEGEFGSVWKGHMRCESQTGESQEIPVAVKTLHNEHCRKNRAELLREASIMITLSHHCIVKIIGISKVCRDPFERSSPLKRVGASRLFHNSFTHLAIRTSFIQDQNTNKNHP